MMIREGGREGRRISSTDRWYKKFPQKSPTQQKKNNNNNNEKLDEEHASKLDEPSSEVFFFCSMSREGEMGPNCCCNFFFLFPFAALPSMRCFSLLLFLFLFLFFFASSFFLSLD
jgi:hypothetical protein